MRILKRLAKVAVILIVGSLVAFPIKHYLFNNTKFFEWGDIFTLAVAAVIFYFVIILQEKEAGKKQN